MAQGGLWVPNYWALYDGLSNGTLLNAATDKLCMIGHVFWDGEPASKVMSSAGSKIHWFCALSGIVWANGASSLDIGIQDVDTSNGPPARGDGTFDVKATLTGGSGITADAWNHTSMATGSKTISHGQLVALTFDLTARGGSDAIRTYARGGPSTFSARPVTTQFKSSAWANNGTIIPVYLEADDGTIGIFDPSVPFSSIQNAESFADSASPDERGFSFQVPFIATADAAFLTMGSNAAGADSVLTLYSDPFGTPTSMGSINILGENFGLTSTGWWLQTMFSSKITLAANTDYCLALKATGASNITMNNMVLPEANLSKFLNVGGVALAKVTRNNGSGAFTPESPAVTMYHMGLRVYPTNANGSVGIIGS